MLKEVKHHYRETRSTNEDALLYFKTHTIKEEELHIFWAKSQTAGRGRHGRVWISPEGNLYVSFLLKPRRETLDFPEISFVMALAVYHALQGLTKGALKERLFCKWPNDLLIEQEKVAGVLLEVGEEGGLVIGVGVNVNANPTEGTSLKSQLGPEFSVSELLATLTQFFILYYGRWLKNGFASIREEWLSLTCKEGTPIAIFIDSDHKIEGTFDEIDEKGALVVLTQEGYRKKITAGTLRYR